MKAKMLKIAGVKSEAAFYKKFPTQEAFMKVHGKEFKKAQTGAAIEKAQFGNQFSSPNYYQNNQPYMSTNPGVGFNPGNTTIPTGGISAPNAQAFANKSFQASDSFAMKNVGNQFAKNNPLPAGVQDYSVPEDIGSKFGKGSSGSGLSASMIPGMIDQGISIYNAFESQKKQKKSLQQQNKLLGLTETLSKSTDVNEPYQKNVLDRPENYMASTNMFYPSQGTGYDILRAVRDGGHIKAQSGMSIGGNPTEIQNTFAPYDIYSDGGYEPLNDSNKVKSFQFGGEMGNAIGGGASSFIGSQFNNSAGSQAGAAVGNAFFGPLGGAGGALLGGAFDQAFGDAGDINKLTASNASTQDRIFGNSMGKHIGFTANRQEGGYLSHDYNPQVISMFGDHDAEDFADYAHKYRAGGHLKEYTAPSERAMETYADGGELKTHWGGEVEPVSYNPYSEGTGLTYNAYGNSHFQKDGQGRTGIGLEVLQDGGTSTGEADVEMEKGEPIVGNVIYGNLNTNKDLLEQFQLPEKYANKKVKHIVNKEIVPKEQKYTAELEKVVTDDSFDNSKFGALDKKTKEIKKIGLNMKLKKLAEDKENLAAYQDHIHKSTDFLTNLLGKEVSQEKFAKNGEVSHTLAKGEISQAARNGKTLKAQTGTTTNPAEYETNFIKNFHDAIGMDPKTPGYGKLIGKKSAELYNNWLKTNAPDSYMSPQDLKEKGADIRDIFYGKEKSPKKSAELLSTSFLKYPNEEDKKFLKEFNLTPEGYKYIGKDKQAVTNAPIGGKELSEADYNYLNSLKEKAKSQGKGKAVEEFQREYTRLLPDEAKRITSSHNQTNYGKKYKIANTDPRSNMDSLYGPITSEYEESLKNYAPKTSTSSLATTPLGVKENKPAATELEPIEETEKGFPWGSAISSIARGLYPAFNMPIGSQINPELYAMADNNVEGLYAPHMYSMLETPYKYSADRDKNAILSQARQAVKNAGNNPAAQAAIMAQVADAMGQVSSKEYDINQQQYQGVYNRNIGTVNQDRARNAALDMDAAMKLSQAKSNLQAKKLAAMTSAESKIAANKRENMEYNIGMAEHPDFTFGPDGRIIKLPRYVEFDTTGKGVASGGKNKGLAPGKEFSYNAEGNIIGVHSAGKEDKGRNGKSIKKKYVNGNIVKTFKGF
jgi:hypothetical protein